MCVRRINGCILAQFAISKYVDVALKTGVKNVLNGLPRLASGGTLVA